MDFLELCFDLYPFPKAPGGNRECSRPHQSNPYFLAFPSLLRWKPREGGPLQSRGGPDHPHPQVHTAAEGFPRGAPSPPEQRGLSPPRPPETPDPPEASGTTTRPRPRAAVSPATGAGGSCGLGTHHSPRPLEGRGGSDKLFLFFLHCLTLLIFLLASTHCKFFIKIKLRPQVTRLGVNATSFLQLSPSHPRRWYHPGFPRLRGSPPVSKWRLPLRGFCCLIVTGAAELTSSFLALEPGCD